MQQEKLYFQRNKVKCIPLRNYYVYLNNQSVATVMISTYILKFQLKIFHVHNIVNKML